MVRYYLIKQCRDNIINTFSILKTRGSCPGAQLHVFETLDSLLENGQSSENDLPTKVKLKGSNDLKLSRCFSCSVK